MREAPPGIDLDPAWVEGFCRRWEVQDLWLFGSVLRDDFRPDSDVDVLVRFKEDAVRPVFDLVHMKDELEGRFGRPVDLLVETALRNPIRRASILRSRRRIYAA